MSKENKSKDTEFQVNNLNNKKMSGIITPGFYQNKNTVNSDRPEIIRIIGIDPDNPQYWLNQFNERIPEYHLIDNFFRCDFYLNQEVAKNTESKNNKLFGDFEPIIVDTEAVVVPVTKKSPSKSIEPKPIVPKSISIEEVSVRSDVQENFPQEKTESKYKLFFDKCICDPVQTTIDVSFFLEYDFIKLLKTIDILSLDIDECVNELMSTFDEQEIINSFKESLKQTIQNYNKKEEIISEIIEKIPEPIIEKIPEPIIELSVIENPKITEEELNSKINIIDQFLNP